MTTHKAKKIEPGRYSYRGFEIESFYLPAKAKTVWQCLHRDGGTFGYSDSLRTAKLEIDELLDEGLKPYKWYPRALFDDNPKDYVLMTHCSVPNDTWYSGDVGRWLSHNTDYFMYIERRESLTIVNEDEQ